MTIPLTTTTIVNPTFLLWIIVILVPVTLITTYTMTDELHPDSQIIPFISSSINNAPDNIINYQGEINQESKMKFNKFIASMGIISGFSLNGVASFQYKNASVPHLIFAALFFICGFIFILTQTIIDDQISNNSNRIKNIRKVLIFICCLFIPYVILQFIQNPIAKNISAIFEISSASCIFIYMVSFFFEFSKVNLNIEFSNHNYGKI
ncbi:hypothetical protein DDB_G0277073 [Dictyostelium discoideum AX4]|uniref:CWH43-like N-terminal domain-containing protein n=1 Tax=Dictyostelium discoideum TaxID=44689 RepID=Q550K4_DICDI|nr:hypothetical protein DDB_G0277073 [Dictyostelium discoideum AX4]EAL69038.1 hypothetical protein DDB_G0277073 [Dictyostelium discoideum AX4]|eukprot:XP_642928.1 hypothetical protein DDB_G0277073 [Dictyostelium discoideum AX4]